MQKLTLLLLFTSVVGYAQIDYKALIRNLEDITIDTDINEYFKDLPFEENYGEIEFNDERFLRFYGIIVNKVRFRDSWGRKVVDITPFNEKEDYESILTKLTKTFGDPEIDEGESSIRYEWENDTKKIKLRADFEEGTFSSIDDLTITLK